MGFISSASWTAFALGHPQCRHNPAPLAYAMHSAARGLVLVPLTHLLSCSKDVAVCAAFIRSMRLFFKAGGFCQAKGVQKGLNPLQAPLGSLSCSVPGEEKGE